MRPWTPDRIVVEHGERMIAMEPKRDCDGCGTRLGDLSDHELVLTGLPGRRLPAVTGECPLCLGYHAVLVEPAAPVEPGGRVLLQPARLLCPGTPVSEPAVASCATWERCGCTPGPDVEVPSVEWVEFLDAPCPVSPTGEHRHLVERDDRDGTPYVAAPQSGTCRYRATVDRRIGGDMTYLDRAVAHFASAPGLYPVEIEELDIDTLGLDPIDITPHLPAEVEAL